MLGAFGMRVDRYVDNTNTNSGTDRFTDTGVDAQYQYITNPHTFTRRLAISGSGRTTPPASSRD